MAWQGSPDGSGAAAWAQDQQRFAIRAIMLSLLLALVLRVHAVYGEPSM
jgi:hypothetical protein